MKSRDVQSVSRVLSDPRRFEILKKIAACECKPCTELHNEFPITAATLSHHLKVLTELGLITSRKEGLNVYYRAIPEKFAGYLQYLSGISRRH